MAFRNAQQSRVYVGGLAAACYARNASASSATGMLDTTTLCDEERNFIPEMEDVGTFSVGGPLDVDGSSDTMFDITITEKGATTPTPVTFMPVGTDGAAWLVQANETEFTADNSTGATANWSMSAQTHGQHDMAGLVLDDDTVTADQNAASVDNGAATTNGAVFHLHVTAFSGFTSDDITVEGSATGSFAGEESTIATFAQVTGVSAERVAVTGSVPRYLRVVDDVTGTGSITRIVICSRR